MGLPSVDSPYRLLVEGSDDLHSVIHLLKRHGFDWDDESTARPYVSDENGIDRLLREHQLAALIAPSFGAASRIDVAAGDHGWGGRISGLPAIAGYPHLTVPMGQERGLPIGLSFVGAAWSDAALLALGYAFEQAGQARRPPSYLPSLETAGDLAADFAPLTRD